jgi:DMSO reductase anchor subunit
MHPAFSVIFFTTASGAGFGLFAWFGLMMSMGALYNRVPIGVALVLGALFAVAGLFSSMAHLGQPTRAWRAFSQWRSSWLSREGVLSLACLSTALCIGILAWRSPDPDSSGFVVATPTMRCLGVLLVLLSVATLACTAMIYASLKPVPAWRHPLVVPAYLGFGLFTGYLLFAVALSFSKIEFRYSAEFVLVGAVVVSLLKLGSWRLLDTERLPVARNSALGLPHMRPVQVFERPHTEANYLLKEMGYVLARKHAKRLRVIALILFSAIPALLAVLMIVLGSQSGLANALVFLALASALAGALVERWLFFAEARHLVTLYY